MTSKRDPEAQALQRLADRLIPRELHDLALDAFAERNLETLLLLAGRNVAPALLLGLWLKDLVGVPELRELLADVWEDAEFPERSLSRDCWLHLFGVTGFVSSPKGLPPPSGPLTIYRGCITRRRRGMAWTTEPSVAAWFAERFRETSRKRTAVRMAVVDPESVLALTNGRSESEVVVDPRALRDLREWYADPALVTALAKERTDRVRDAAQRRFAEAREPV